MKLIDDKGRLFGKINVVDFLIIVLICIIIPGFFGIYKILGKRPIKTDSGWVKVEAVTFTIPQIADLIKADDMAYDEDRSITGKLLRIISRDDKRFFQKPLNIKSVKEDAIPSAYVIPVVMEFELFCERGSENENWYYLRRPLAVSLGYEYRFSFSTDKYIINCFALKIED